MNQEFSEEKGCLCTSQKECLGLFIQSNFLHCPLRCCLKVGTEKALLGVAVFWLSIMTLLPFPCVRNFGVNSHNKEIWSLETFFMFSAPLVQFLLCSSSHTNCAVQDIESVMFIIITDHVLCKGLSGWVLCTFNSAKHLQSGKLFFTAVWQHKIMNTRM